jgi:DNA repair protein RadC
MVHYLLKIEAPKEYKAPEQQCANQSHNLIVNKNPDYFLRNTVITSSKDCKKALTLLFNENNAQLFEQFVVLFLDRKNKIIGHYLVSVGGITSTIVDQRTIFSNALLLGKTTSIILCHNHPSGNTDPSEMDNILTRKIKEAGKLLDISLLDHIILNGEDLNGDFYSYADEGAL